MTPPRSVAPQGAEAKVVVDPLHADDAAPTSSAAPAAVAAPQKADANAEPAVTIRSVPAAAETSPAPAATPKEKELAPAEDSSSKDSFWKRLHLVVGGGYNFGSRFYPDAEPFNSAAPKYRGTMFLFQPSYSLFAPSSFDLRVGADLRTHFLGIPKAAGSVDSSVNAISLGGLVEGNFAFHDAIGAGANIALGYMGLSSSDADVGAPFTATFDWGQQGGIFVGLQAYLNFWKNAFRFGASYDLLPGGFGLPTSPGNPDLQTSVDPMFSVFAGADIFQIIRNAQDGGEKKKPEKSEK
jgi:hypothetical protein